jgi:hypothetical protein
MHEYVNYKCLSGKLSSIEWKRILFFLVAIILILITIFSKSNFILRKTIIPTQFKDRQQLKRHPSVQKSIPMPCLQPHCDIECVDVYENCTKDGIIDGTSLSKLQREHLMIDMGNDLLVNDLINSIPPPKICPYRNHPGPSPTMHSNMMVTFYPIIFGFVDQYLLETIPQEVLLDNKVYQIEQICLPTKSNDFNQLIPGREETYRFKFENEIDYRRIYSTAYFAITMKKGGWDCNRHYEIISTGTAPYFDKLDQAGNYTLSHLPKSLLYEIQKLAGVNRQNLTINHQVFDVNHYNLILHRLLYYAKYRLTTVKVVEYILKVIEYSLASSQRHSVLYLAHYDSDYLKDYMLHGFTRIFEENLHVFQPAKFLYHYPASKMWTADETKAFYNHRLYGLGYGYKLILKKYVHLYERDTKELSTEAIVKNNIANKNYSLIVFGSIMRQDRLLPFAIRHYNKSRIVLLDGEDEQKDIRRSEYAKLGYYFLREIPEDCDKFM